MIPYHNHHVSYYDKWCFRCYFFQICWKEGDEACSFISFSMFLDEDVDRGFVGIGGPEEVQ